MRAISAHSPSLLPTQPKFSSSRTTSYFISPQNNLFPISSTSSNSFSNYKTIKITYSTTPREHSEDIEDSPIKVHSEEELSQLYEETMHQFIEKKKKYLATLKERFEKETKQL